MRTEVVWCLQFFLCCCVRSTADTLGSNIFGGQQPLSISSPETQRSNVPVSIGMDVVRGAELYRLNFVLNLNSTRNVTKNANLHQPLDRRDEILQALRDKDSGLHAILQNGKTAQVLRKILHRRALITSSLPHDDEIGIRVYEDTASSAGAGRRLLQSTTAPTALSTQVS